MSNYKIQEIDFIKRTKRIIEQYEQLVMPIVPKIEQYETTLFLNCLVGLLIIPEQKWFENLPETVVTEIEWGISPAIISIITDSKGIQEDKTVKNVAKHLRNSIAHNNFNVLKADVITDIRFKDYKDKRKTLQTFSAIISVKEITKFVQKFAEEALKQS